MEKKNGSLRLFQWNLLRFVIILGLVVSMCVGCGGDDDDDGNNRYSLTIAKEGQGSVYADPSGDDYDENTVVTLTATGDDPAWMFSGWSGDLSGSENSAEITMNSDRNVTATFTRRGLVMINLGDSLTNGTQSGMLNVHEDTQLHGYAQILAEQIREVEDLTWSNPLLEMDPVTRTKTRKDESVIPYNLGVDGATTKSLIEEKTGTGNALLDELMKPVPSEEGAVSQLEAAEYVASLHPEKLKIFVLLIGNNDVLGTIIRGSGTLITQENISDFLSDTEAGHDLESVKDGLKEITDRLTAISNSHLFIATLPCMTCTAFTFNEDDIEKLASFSADITVLESEQSVGFGPFIGLPCNVATSITRALDSDETTLNAVVSGTVGGSDGNSLSSEEAAVIDERVDEINAYIESLADDSPEVTLVDIHAYMNSVVNGEVSVGDDVLTRTLGGGFFSLDGIHLSHTGYAGAANEFIKKLNDAGLGLDVPLADLEAIWAGEPYRDYDGDGFVPGPATPGIIDPVLVPFTDPDDNDDSILPAYVTGIGLGCEVVGRSESRASTDLED